MLAVPPSHTLGNDPRMTVPRPSVLLFDADDTTRSALDAAGMGCVLAVPGARARRYDAAVHRAASLQALADLCRNAELLQSTFDTAVVVNSACADDALEAELLRLGVEAVVVAGDTATLLRGVHHAIERKRLERAARTAYATDLATGLPHQAQLVEHMTQLLALRERQPAPMVLIVLRIEGYAGIAARMGEEAANILRRKVAVRLRGGLRASDVVAAISLDAFGVLLGHLESKSDGERVAGKLARTLQQPILVAGQACSVSASIGLAVYPDHGKDAESLLRRASAQAASLATLGSAGHATATERGPAAAANDEAS
jgi:diguanylate cyclase (GGDEF)-like protein